MGQKANPHGIRVGIIRNWDSRWFARDDLFGDLVVEDNKIRKFSAQNNVTGPPIE